MEQWNPETRSHDRYVIDRVTAQSHSLTLRDAQGETQAVRIPPWTAAGRCSGREKYGGRGRASEGDGEKSPDSASPAVTACRWHPSARTR
ncbi:hypothetical protein ACLB1Q_35625 [Escherichia coli]